jgi:hypothetical protein
LRIWQRTSGQSSLEIIADPAHRADRIDGL